MAELIADNPALRVDLTLSDEVIDIATAGLDVAVRAMEMKPSDMIATRVPDNPFTLIVPPGYVARFGKTCHDWRLGEPPPASSFTRWTLGPFPGAARRTEFGLAVLCRRTPSTRCEQPASRAPVSPC